MGDLFAGRKLQGKIVPNRREQAIKLGGCRQAQRQVELALVAAEVVNHLPGHVIWVQNEFLHVLQVFS